MIIKYPNKLLEKLKRYPSKAVIWISLLIIFVINMQYQNWDHEYKIIAWDVNSYYAYLPMVFIYNDLEMDFISGGDEKFSKHYWPFQTETGKKVIVTTMGMAYLYAPFFLAGHGVAQLTGHAGDEFSAPYKISLIISCLFYFAIGLLFLRKVLRQYYSEKVTSLTLVAIIFGTNLLHYVTEEPTMTHAYSFALFSVFLFTIIQLYKKPCIKYALLSGALAGMITLVRPSNFIVILLFVFWDISSFRELSERILFYLKKVPLLLIMILAFVAIWIPQFLYWYHLSGSVFLNTYGEVGASFFFDKPQIYYTLFSYRKGWLVYTPMMIFAIGGIYLLYKENKKSFLPVLLYLLLNIYVISSWWCWWYGGGFGQRSFVDSYGIMAFPLAALIYWTLRQKIIIKVFILLLLACTMYFTLFQLVQYKRGNLHNKAMSKVSYWATFMDMTPPQKYWDKLVYPDYNAAKQGIYYPETEIIWSLEDKLGMKGWQYVNVLKDSILNEPDSIKKILQSSDVNISLDSLAYNEAMLEFRKIVEEHKKENP